MVPIFHKAANPSDAALNEEARMIEAEGFHTVNGIYYRDEKDAATQRRWEAEKRVADAERMARHSSSSRSESDPRWSSVTADTLVDFDGETVRWGELTLQDRKVVEMRADGTLHGDYPL